MAVCKKEHRYLEEFESLPDDQGGDGRHKCAGCAYDAGVEFGINREENININLNLLPESQAGTIRHKSPHAAFAMGYLEGVKQSYDK